MKIFTQFIVAVAAISSLAGCNAGMAPEGDDMAAKKQVDAMSLEKKIEFINSSPMLPEAKAKAIADAKVKAGVSGGGETPVAPYDPSGATPR